MTEKRFKLKWEDCGLETSQYPEIDLVQTAVKEIESEKQLFEKLKRQLND